LVTLKIKFNNASKLIENFNFFRRFRRKEKRVLTD
jgi:hypothetical protein